MKYIMACGHPESCPMLRERNPELCHIEGCLSESGLPNHTQHERNLRALDCVVSGYRPVTLHHCRGGSMAMTVFGTPGVGQKQNDALQIPLHASWHVGQWGIDCRIGGGVKSWEKQWGEQVEHLNLVSKRLGYSVWALAYRWASPHVLERVNSFFKESPSRFRQALMRTGPTE